MNMFVDNFEWAGVASYPLLQVIHGLIVQWLLQPTSEVKLVPVETTTEYTPHPVPVDSGEGILIDLWREQVGKLYTLHKEKHGKSNFCVAVACDFAYSGGALGAYEPPFPEERFPLVGPGQVGGLDDFDMWVIPHDLHQMSVTYASARKHLSILGGEVSVKAEGSHYKVTFPRASRPWPLDYNMETIPNRFLDQLPALIGLPLEVIKYTLIFGRLPERKPRF
jgi:hypothetical protein